MIELNQRDFAAAIKLAQMPIERRNTIPILSMVRCRANGVIAFEGTDLDISVSAAVAGPTGPKSWQGQFMLPDPAQAKKAVTTVGGESVTLSYADGKIGVTAGALSLTAGSLPAEDFPEVGGCDIEAWSATIPADLLKSLDRVAVAMSHEGTRFYLNGIYLHHVDGWNYRAVATNGHLLSLFDFPLPDARGQLDGVIIPRKAIKILLAAGKTAGPFKIKVGSKAPADEPTISHLPKTAGSASNRMAIAFDKGSAAVTVVSKMIDGTFPDYRRVVPSYGPGDKHIRFKTANLRRAIQAVSVGSSNVRAVKLTCDPTASDSIKLSQAYPDGFSAAITVPCSHNAPGFEVGFNGQYLLDLVGAAGGDEIVMSTTDCSAPALIRNTADTAWTGILMPMRV